ncbi:class IIb bacteriocin, lactobin A/cerein 7B family [Streptococcus ruminantium]|uniref:class IIb bacteriocin, lactobin A/cerein 7B family n=1 Tax=Streptococcus ruminantium TaxID=1917441 RepID=UPI0012DF952D|nr:class IIb bacteriocin, lactobin A/cerein 7B family [Streptococcus ruminantium]BDD39788.1 hypothetical protein GUT184_00520 [Streptococcus ruminantium]
MVKFKQLSEKELLNIEGGLDPISIVIGVGGLIFTAYNAGYTLGKDLARRKR